MLTTSEKIRLLLKRKDMSISTLAEKTGTSRQNLNNKLRRNNFSELDLKDIANALEQEIIIKFKDVGTGGEL